MKKITLVAAIIATTVAIAAPAKAGPYIRVIGQDNYHLYNGALFTAKGGLSQTQNTTVIALLTHSTRDGSLLPKAWAEAGYGETWAPMVIGGSMGAGRATINAGPLVNVGPQIQRGAVALLNLVTPDHLNNLKAILTPAKDAKIDVTFSFGAMLNFEWVQNGHFVNLKTGLRDPLRYFAGPAMHF